MAPGRPTRRTNARRNVDAAARLEQLRRRNADQLEAQRDAERRVEQALKAYVSAEVSVGAVDTELAERIAVLHRQIEAAKHAAADKVKQVREKQAAAVWQLHDAGRTVEQIADLLEVSQKVARRMLNAGRQAANPQDQRAPVPPMNRAGPPDGHDRPAPHSATPNQPEVPVATHEEGGSG